MSRELKFRVWNGMEMVHDGSKGVMQCTGLKDKNGKEIFEGDICKCHDHPTGIEDSTGAVIFDVGRYWIEGGSSLVSLDDFGTAWTEVIGNIYSNPELVTRASFALQSLSKAAVASEGEEKCVCGGFDEGYKRGYQDATSEAIEEIHKNYKPRA